MMRFPRTQPMNPPMISSKIPCNLSAIPGCFNCLKNLGDFSCGWFISVAVSGLNAIKAFCHGICFDYNKWLDHLQKTEDAFSVRHLQLMNAVCAPLNSRSNIRLRKVRCHYVKNHSWFLNNNNNYLRLAPTALLYRNMSFSIKKPSNIGFVHVCKYTLDDGCG